jgi:hypothetical protein
VITHRLTRLLAGLVLVGLLALGCSRYPAHGDSPWLDDASSRHARADEQLASGDVPAARDTLRSIVHGRAPADISDDDRRVVLQDTYFRLAKLDLDGGDPRGALANADHGLGVGRADDLFVANLLVVRGAAHEALGESPAAVEDYHQALVINDRLLAQTLAGKPGTAPAPGATP